MVLRRTPSLPDLLTGLIPNRHSAYERRCPQPKEIIMEDNQMSRCVEIIDAFEQSYRGVETRVASYVKGARWRKMLNPLYRIVFDSVRELAVEAFLMRMEKNGKKGVRIITRNDEGASTGIHVWQRLSTHESGIRACVREAFDAWVLSEDNAWKALYPQVSKLLDDKQIFYKDSKKVIIAFMYEKVDEFLECTKHSQYYVREARVSSPEDPVQPDLFV